MVSKRFTVGSLILNSSATVVAEMVEVVEVPKPVVTERKKIEFTQNEYHFEVEAAAGKSLLTAALNKGQPVQYKCQKGTCGVCKVQVLSGSSFLSPVDEKEHKKLKKGIAEGFRLACQAKVI